MKMAGSGFGESGDDDDEYEEEEDIDKPLTGKVRFHLSHSTCSNKTVAHGRQSLTQTLRSSISLPPCQQVQSAVTDAVEKAREISSPYLERAQELSQPFLDTAAQGVAAAKGLFQKASDAVSSLTGRSKADSEL